VDDLLREMQQQKFHIAMVSDEHGSVSGLVTLEKVQVLQYGKAGVASPERA